MPTTRSGTTTSTYGEHTYIPIGEIMKIFGFNAFLTDFVACYDGDTVDPPVDPPVDRRFTQDEVNKIMSQEKRKERDRYEKLEASYNELLQNQNLSTEERDKLENQLDDVRKQYRTKEQLLAEEKKKAENQYKEQLDVKTKEVDKWQGMFTESTIKRELQEAAIKHDAFNPTQIITQLRGQTRLVEKLDGDNKPTGKLVPMVDMEVKNEDSGAYEQLQMTPEEAVEHMKKNPGQWGNFFKNNIREGIGSSSGTGDAFAGEGVVDQSRLTDDQYFELRKKNPAALGLKSRR